jgi:hypothetical protein
VVELIAGVLVALVAVAAVVAPLFRTAPPPLAAAEPDESAFAELDESESPKVQALLALREIEFDRATGKLSEDDYEELRAKYAGAALEAMGAEEAARQGGSDAGDDVAEKLIARFKGPAGSCSSCGPRPEPGAVFCSTCGRSLVGPGLGPRCWTCGVQLPDGAKFCQSCGKGLAA